jgi:hypothetical protein
MTYSTFTFASQHCILRCLIHLFIEWDSVVFTFSSSGEGCSSTNFGWVSSDVDGQEFIFVKHGGLDHVDGARSLCLTRMSALHSFSKWIKDILEFCFALWVIFAWTWVWVGLKYGVCFAFLCSLICTYRPLLNRKLGFFPVSSIGLYLHGPGY